MSNTDTGYHMDDNKKRRLSETMVNLVQNTVPPVSDGFRRRRCFADDDIVVCLTDKHLELFEDLAREILKPNQIREKFSEQYVYESLWQVVVKSVRDGNLNSTSQYFRDTVSALEDYSIRHIVYIPLAGIEMRVQSLAIGNIVIRRMTESEVERVAAIFDEATNAAKDSDQETLRHIQRHRAEILKAIEGRVCAEFKTVAEPKRAQERAMEETRRVMDILEYAIAATFINPDKSGTITVGLLGACRLTVYIFVRVRYERSA